MTASGTPTTITSVISGHWAATAAAVDSATWRIEQVRTKQALDDVTVAVWVGAEHWGRPSATALRARGTIARMADHRLPGMSIPIEHWEALTVRALATGTSRTDVIRKAIDRALAPPQVDVADVDLQQELIRLQQALADERREHAALRAHLRRLLATDVSVAA